jgi:hypothetical protein
MGEINIAYEILNETHERERERERERQLGKSRCRWEGITEINQKRIGHAQDVTCSELSAQASAS